MKTSTSMIALILGAALASTAAAQNAAETPPPAAAGAGAAAATSSAAPAEGAAPSTAGTGQDAAAAAGAGAAAATSGGAAPAAAEGTQDAPVELAEGQTVLPNGMDITPVEMQGGRWYTAEGIPTYKIEADDTVDYAAFSGYRRYSAECHVCHGPDGEGSTYAPALKNSVLRLDYYDFQQIVASGKQDVNASANQVMPAFATNKNVWCYIDDIYVYLLARGTGDIPRGRPQMKAEKSAEFTEQEDACMSM